MSDSAPDPKRTIAFQGDFGAYSHLACREAMADFTPLPCETFEAAFAAVSDARASRDMIPIENSVAGRVADIHHLLPGSDLFIIAEHFQRVNHMLLGPASANIDDLKEVHSHIHALSQCRKLMKELAVAGLAARSISPAWSRLRALARITTTSGFMPFAARRWNGLSNCRPRPLACQYRHLAC